jgi:hypothetical protein
MTYLEESLRGTSLGRSRVAWPRRGRPRRARTALRVAPARGVRRAGFRYRARLASRLAAETGFRAGLPACRRPAPLRRPSAARVAAARHRIPLQRRPRRGRAAVAPRRRPGGVPARRGARPCPARSTCRPIPVATPPSRPPSRPRRGDAARSRWRAGRRRRRRATSRGRRVAPVSRILPVRRAPPRPSGTGRPRRCMSIPPEREPSIPRHVTPPGPGRGRGQAGLPSRRPGKGQLGSRPHGS